MLQLNVAEYTSAEDPHELWKFEICYLIWMTKKWEHAIQKKNKFDITHPNEISAQVSHRKT